MNPSKNHRKAKCRSPWNLIVLLLIPLVACIPFKGTETVPQTGNLFPQRELPENTVGIDIFVVRVSPQQQVLVNQLWLEVDEQMIPTMQRYELRDQGLRLGVQGSYLSSSLSQLINVTASRSGERKPETGETDGVSIAELQDNPAVTRQYRNLMPGMRGVVQPFEDTIAELSLFWNENGRICGKTYKDARGLITLSAKTQKNGMVRFEISPELEYGEPETKIRHENAVFFHQSGKPRKMFESLAVSLDLLPGQWIIIGPTSSDCKGIGHGFFTRGTEKNEQRLIAIRLANMKRSDPASRGISSAVNSPEQNIPERN